MSGCWEAGQGLTASGNFECWMLDFEWEKRLNREGTRMDAASFLAGPAISDLAFYRLALSVFQLYCHP